MLEKALESPLDSKETQPVHPKGDQSWVFIDRTDFEAETPILWPPDGKSWLILKDINLFQETLTLAPWKKSYDKHRQHIKKQRHYFAKQGPYSQSYGFSSSHVWMWELNHKEARVPEELMVLNCAVGEDSWESL